MVKLTITYEQATALFNLLHEHLNDDKNVHKYIDNWYLRPVMDRLDKAVWR